MRRPRILLTHTPGMRENYYGARALAGLRELGEVVLHEGSEPLATPALIAARPNTAGQPPAVRISRARPATFQHAARVIRGLVSLPVSLGEAAGR